MLKTGFSLQVLLLALLLSCAGKNRTIKSRFTIIYNVNIVDVLHNRIIEKQDVYIENAKIARIENSSGSLSSGQSIIDATGRYLMPGLWDMHIHLAWQKGNDSLIFPAFIKNGITGLRDMGGDLELLNAFKQSSIKNNGPFLAGAGPIIDGFPPVHQDFSLSVNPNLNLPNSLDSLRQNGADFFKTYSLLRESDLRIIAGYAKKTNTRFAGHLSEYVKPELQIQLGMSSVEHLNRLEELWPAEMKRLDTISMLMVQHKTFLCPTLITYFLKTKIRDSSVAKPRYEKYIPSSLKQEWQSIWTRRKKKLAEDNNPDYLDLRFKQQLQLVGYLKERGVIFLAGSDFAGMPYVYPGLSLHEELLLLKKAGLSDFEALQSATINPALFLGIDNHYGSVNPGKYADLVMLEDNPLENIMNTGLIFMVFKNGRKVYQK